MSQDLRREREAAAEVRYNSRDPHILYAGNDPIGTMVSEDWATRVVEAVANAKYFCDLATSQAREMARLLAESHVAEAKLAEADEALEQARRDAGSDGTVAKIREWLNRREATVAARASEAISPATGGFNDLGAIESRAAKLRRAQSDSKLLHELRLLLGGLERSQPAVRYWLRDWGSGPYSVVRLDNRHASVWHLGSPETGWFHYAPNAIDGLLYASGDIREITAADLPEGVTL